MTNPLAHLLAFHRRPKPTRASVRAGLRLIHGTGTQAVREPLSMIHEAERLGLYHSHPQDPHGYEGPEESA